VNLFQQLIIRRWEEHHAQSVRQPVAK